jgi:RpiB/LacA/LacB family sugar-phosphate isomerase
MNEKNAAAPLTLFIASDHAGLDLRQELAASLKATFAAAVIHDLGPQAADGKVDYPDYAARLAHKVATTAGAFGIIICGTGIGVSIAANKVAGIRCALCHDVTTARLARAHNDANVLALGARVMGPVTALDVAQAFLTTAFEGGRHCGRLDKIAALETAPVVI